MQKYISKPKVVEAIQFTQEMHNGLCNELFEETENPIGLVLPFAPDCEFTWNWAIKRLEIVNGVTNQTVSVGDYIVKENEAFFAMSEAEFQEKYELYKIARGIPLVLEAARRKDAFRNGLQMGLNAKRKDYGTD